MERSPKTRARFCGFKPTHEVAWEDKDGTRQARALMLVDGAAFTLDEWEACESADYEVTGDGEWLFQGQPLALSRPWSTFCVRPWRERVSHGLLPDSPAKGQLYAD